MFAITKRQRTKRMLIKQYELSLQLESEIDALRLSSSGSELDSLQIEEFQLRIEKLSILFDSLKSTYDGFTRYSFDDRDSHWKLQKPNRSEGALFISTLSIDEVKHLDDTDTELSTPILRRPNIDVFISNHELLSNSSCMSPLLRDAMIYRIREICLSESRDIFSQNQSGMDDEQLLYALILYLNSHGDSLLLYERDGLVMETTLEIVARVSRTNIILAHRRDV